VSADAVSAAHTAFGDHFVTSDSELIQNRAPYDVIYHVGTIGCVADPIGFTNDLLNLLKPGGSLLFNAPNIESCYLLGQLWIDAAPPPDVVTLFPPDFWSQRFSIPADVTEHVELCRPDRSFSIGLRRMLARRWHRPQPMPLEDSLDDFKTSRRENGKRPSRSWKGFERIALAVARRTCMISLAPSFPSPFGLFVTMIKK
jgi:hypothetical protein